MLQHAKFREFDIVLEQIKAREAIDGEARHATWTIMGSPALNGALMCRRDCQIW